MGTRGFTGVHIESKDKLAYQQFDSYPEGVGRETIDALASLLADESTINATIEKAKRLQPKGPDDAPATPDEIERLAPWTDLRVSNQSVTDWYCLVRKTQGDLKEMLKAGFCWDAKDFPADSLFCEWGYIANFDTSELEIYRGFQKQPHDKGRFARLPISEEKAAPGSTYYPVALLGSIPFARIIEDANLAFHDMMKLAREDDEEEAA
ncbi:hypothetical protein [Zavarzinella formosa]|uniref:hypothetical protein n=1 Tax=Zavarzinella formosa TaxID=360055 RepID=UPI00035EA9B8|nr:hypothetical protein [Zavarzinella formosa]